MASGGTSPSPFSQRLLKHPLVDADPKTGLIAVKHQLLIRSSQQAAVRASLTKLGSKDANLVPLASLLAGGPTPLVTSPPDDVVLEQVVPPPHPTPEQTKVFANVFDLTAQIRSGLNEKDPLISSVSPNHILIPESNIDWCPKGPPAPAKEVPVYSPKGDMGHPVTVVDAGYYWDPSWPIGNPLLDHVSSLNVYYAERHPLMLTPGLSLSLQQTWLAGIPDVLDVANPTNPQTLNALMGHANFVAGMVASQCELPAMSIWTHNAGFQSGRSREGAEPLLITELAVCRSLIRAHFTTPASAINVGLAALPDQAKVSYAWKLVFDHIGSGPLDPRVVAPAGNQGDKRPRLPATLSSRYSNMIGVAATTNDHQGLRASFSNYGPWVSCSAWGSNVRSCFLWVDLKLEEDPSTSPTKKNFKKNAYALWKGTSFAAPRVTGNIAAQIYAAAGISTSPEQAYQNVWNSGHTDANQGIGRVLPF